MPVLTEMFVQAYPVIKVRKSNQKMVQKMASAVRSAGVLAGRTASASFARDQPDLDARHVYVSVHADGPTRVLCFSESKDRYTKGAGDESLAQLSKKLERLDARIKVRSDLCTTGPIHPFSMLPHCQSLLEHGMPQRKLFTGQDVNLQTNHESTCTLASISPVTYVFPPLISSQKTFQALASRRYRRVHAHNLNVQVLVARVDCITGDSKHACRPITQRCWHVCRMWTTSSRISINGRISIYHSLWEIGRVNSPRRLLIRCRWIGRPPEQIRCPGLCLLVGPLLEYTQKAPT